jgi:2-iminobutanoate/2-iminopropanoate deaminase
MNSPAPFSPSITKGNFVFTSGQIYLKEGKLIEGTVEEKTHQVMSNLKNVLEKAGASFNDVAKTTIYTTDMSIYGKINEVYSSYFSTKFPARETICVKELPLGAILEISMIAFKP